MLFGSFFKYSNFYCLDLHNKTGVAISKIYDENIRKRLDRRSDRLYFSHNIKSAWLLIPSIDAHVLPIVLTIACREDINT